MRSRALIWSGVALCLLAGCRAPERSVAGAVLSVEGAAELMRDGQKVSLTTSSRVQPGEKITLPEGGRVDLMLLPGVLVQISGPAELEILQLQLARDGDENIHPMIAREASVRLERGFLIAAIGRTQTRSRLQVNTPAGHLTAGSGRTFLVESKNAETRVMSVREQVNFAPAGGGTSTKIGPGFFAQWPATPVPQTAAGAGKERQAEVTRILSTERRLLKLSRETRPGFLSWAKSSPKPAPSLP